MSIIHTRVAKQKGNDLTHLFRGFPSSSFGVARVGVCLFNSNIIRRDCPSTWLGSEGLPMVFGVCVW